jgi:hypothetical protein
MAEEHKKFQQALMEEQKNFQQASIEAQKKYQLALIAEQTKYQQTLAEERNKHEQALKEAQDKHQHASVEEQKKYQLALIAQQNKHQQASAEERNRHDQKLKEAQNKHRQEFDRQLHQNEQERDEYIARLDTLSTKLAEVDNRSRKNESHLNLMIKDLTAAFDRKRSEHAHVLADLETYRDLSERQANKLQEIETHHRELRADVWRKVATLDDLNREINAHKRQVEHLHAVLVDRDRQDQAVMAQINAFYRSRSWRITRPLRVAMRFFSKLRNLPSSE